MNKDDFYYLGKITRVSGCSGEVAIFLEVDEPSKYTNLKSVFIDVAKNLIPFEIKSVKLKPNSNKAVMRLQDITSIEQATKLINCELYLPLSQLPPLKGKHFYFHEVIGFSIIDKIHGNIGTVCQVMDLGVQSLLQVINNGKELLIPINDDVIVSVNRTERMIEITAPDGLIELYL